MRNRNFARYHITETSFRSGLMTPRYNNFITFVPWKYFQHYVIHAPISDRLPPDKHPHFTHVQPIKCAHLGRKLFSNYGSAGNALSRWSRT